MSTFYSHTVAMSFLNFTIIIFANSLQYKNANISDFILAALLEMNYTNEVSNIVYIPLSPTDI